MPNTSFPSFPVVMIDDDPAILTSLSGVLKIGGVNNIVTLSDSRDAEPELRKSESAVVLLDLTMPFIPGDELIARIRRLSPDIPIIIITGNTEVSMAVDCMKLGAFDYLVKPVESSKLIATVRRAIEIVELKTENRNLKDRLVSNEFENANAFKEIITQSDKLHSTLLYVEAISKTNQTVLITGETGTGKELIARAIHFASGRVGDLVAVNVAGFDDNMFSDTLFGHKKGAYTGADTIRKGMIDAASNGTLFLDEIGDLNQNSQIKLLRLLESGEYLPLGSDVKKKSSARIVVATNKDLPAEVENDGYRKDLYFRLRTHHVHIPPLRDRTEDIEPLLHAFLAEAATEFGIPIPDIPGNLMRLLREYAFPGNVRELRSIIFDAVTRSGLHRADGEDTLSLEPFISAIGSTRDDLLSTPATDIPVAFSERLPTIRQATDILIEEALKRTEGKQTEAAVLLGISQQALSRRLQKRNNPAVDSH